MIPKDHKKDLRDPPSGLKVHMEARLSSEKLAFSQVQNFVENGGFEFFGFS